MRDWRQDGRRDALRLLARETRRAKWSPAILHALVEELYVGEEFVRLLGDPRRFPAGRYPQAVAIALALRHSWRAEDFQRTVNRLFPTTRRTQRRNPRQDQAAADRRHRR